MREVTQAPGAEEDPLRAARVVLVSACLLGEACRHDGGDKRSARVLEALRGKEVVPICPEAGAGLGIPRPAVELGEDGRARVIGTGEDRTDAFSFGARLAVEAARRFGATVAILKERSPSCGSQQLIRGGRRIAGEGVAARALREAGVTVISDESL